MKQTGSGFPVFVTATATVFSPTGVVVVTFDADSHSMLTLRVTGVYAFHVRVCDFVSKGSYTLGRECLLPTSPVDATLACGGLVARSKIGRASCRERM